ncbi:MULTISPECIES: RES family NAD+ phosphorylase [unclassified Acidocella]|uniref:RES family NAD+ phosphorylase n=1 Tax=unclassified Acidocella TaxID=2648610 RepID=UPI00028CD9D6|nr:MULTISPECIES: RES family NAD+ phosphorylase [unclassified Acidocella]EKM98105.1 RES domain-containing protein [Acidocella sp. MX-AZ02]WBO59042.1 RES family NAD+ phosphorylase [Acidocella sp. MX-AZ03]
MIDPSIVPISPVHWVGARRIIRSLYPPVDLFEDIADPEDWPLLIAAEQKTNPRLMETIGALDLVPVSRRVSGPGASYLMAPFTHVSPERPSRFSTGAYGVLYAARTYETALLETIHHHARFMAQTGQPSGWTSQFRELVLDIQASLHDLRGGPAALMPVLDPDDYTMAQQLAAALRGRGSEGLVYPSRRDPDGVCVGLFYPDLVSPPVQGRHLDYHWDGARVDLIRDAGTGGVFRVKEC